eukprot:scaffold248048_cov21-Tisochrysis_lutea.AAC.1
MVCSSTELGSPSGACWDGKLALSQTLTMWCAASGGLGHLQVGDGMVQGKSLSSSNAPGKDEGCNQQPSFARAWQAPSQHCCPNLLQQGTRHAFLHEA